MQSLDGMAAKNASKAARDGPPPHRSRADRHCDAGFSDLFAENTPEKTPEQENEHGEEKGCKKSG